MKKHIHVRKFNIDNFIPGDPVSEPMGTRSKHKYRYDDGTVGPCILLHDAIELTYGITEPYVPEGQPPKEDADWQVCLGSRGVVRNEDGTFGNCPPNVARYFTVCDQIDNKVLKHVNASPLFKTRPATLNFSVRTQETKDINKPKPESQLMHGKVKITGESLLTTYAPMTDRQEFIAKSYGAKCVGFDCVASTFFNVNKVGSTQHRFNHFLMTKNGTDPKGDRAPVYDYSEVSFEEEDENPADKPEDNEQVTKRARVAEEEEYE